MPDVHIWGPDLKINLPTYCIHIYLGTLSVTLLHQLTLCSTLRIDCSTCEYGVQVVNIDYLGILYCVVCITHPGSQTRFIFCPEKLFRILEFS